MGSSGRRIPYFDLLDFAGNPNDNGTGADNVTAMNALIAQIPHAYPRVGAELIVPVGVYRLNASLTWPSMDYSHIRVRGMGGSTAMQGDFGSRFKYMSSGITAFNFDNLGTPVVHGGPVFEDIGIDGNGQLTSVGIIARCVNRLRLRNVAIMGCVQGLKIDSAVDSFAGSDSSWHELEACHFRNNTTSMELRHTYKLHVDGGDINHAATGTGIRIGSLATGAVPSQYVSVDDMKIDGCSIGIDIEGGLCNFDSVGMEGCTTGFKVRRAVANNISGSKNTWKGCGFGTVTTAHDFGTGCIENEINSPQFGASVTNPFLWADETVRQKTTIRTNPVPWALSNIHVASNATAALAAANFVANDWMLYNVPTAGASVLRICGKDAAGTFYDKVV